MPGASPSDYFPIISAAMAKEKPQDSVSVTNAKKRAYNGVRHGETVNVPSYELVSYIAA